ncbi:hypothetical protein IEQ34_009954 [Dendrobium chrysotoxum]|uniref:Uncharacterized protein n=1 Tax=Dendrobium chrysotoxum TaxID=161865 RepID=A0AAV7H3R5_DENCH|nr:hypothetical protein IEQ34_009954 [Dendrobium chrysotoxum]
MINCLFHTKHLDEAPKGLVKTLKRQYLKKIGPIPLSSPCKRPPDASFSRSLLRHLRRRRAHPSCTPRRSVLIITIVPPPLASAEGSIGVIVPLAIENNYS